MRIFIKTLETVVIVLMAIVATVVIAEVLMRGFLGTSLIVTEELGRYLMIWTAMLAVALVANDDAHIRVTLLSDSASPRLARGLAILSDLVVIGFLLVLVVVSLRQLPGMRGQGTVTLGISMAWIYASMPVGGALTILVVAVRLAGRLRAPSRLENDGASAT